MGKKLAKLSEVKSGYQALAAIRNKNDINKHIDQSVVSYKMEEKLKKLGFEVDFSDFSLRERKKKFGLISKEVKYLLEIYGELNFP